MDEYLERQISVLRQLIRDYRTERLSLNALVQRIEGVSNAIGLDSWKDAIFPIILTMEQINAAALDSKHALSSENKAAIEGSLDDLEQVIQRLSNP